MSHKNRRHLAFAEQLPDRSPQNIHLGVLLAFGAALFYSVMGALVKLIADDTSNTTIIFFRFALGFY